MGANRRSTPTGRRAWAHPLRPSRRRSISRTHEEDGPTSSWFATIERRLPCAIRPYDPPHADHAPDHYPAAGRRSAGVQGVFPRRRLVRRRFRCPRFGSTRRGRSRCRTAGSSARSPASPSTSAITSGSPIARRRCSRTRRDRSGRRRRPVLEFDAEGTLRVVVGRPGRRATSGRSSSTASTSTTTTTCGWAPAATRTRTS